MPSFPHPTNKKRKAMKQRKRNKLNMREKARILPPVDSGLWTNGKHCVPVVVVVQQWTWLFRQDVSLELSFWCKLSGVE